MKRIILTLALGLIMAGCATEEGYRQLLARWTGASADDLIISWGPPTREATLSDGRRVLQYDEVLTSYYPGATAYERRRIPVYKPGVGHAYGIATVPEETRGWYYTWSCSTRFVIGENNRIQSWSFNGNGCRAVPPDA